MTDRKVEKTGDAGRSEAGVMLPPVDVIEDAYGITLYADLPGVPRNNLSIHVDADALSIEGKVSLPMANGMEATHAEVQQSHYQRTFMLGKELDSEKIAAEFRDGMLKLNIPKLEQAKPRKITVHIA